MKSWDSICKTKATNPNRVNLRVFTSAAFHNLWKTTTKTGINFSRQTTSLSNSPSIRSGFLRKILVNEFQLDKSTFLHLKINRNLQITALADLKVHNFSHDDKVPLFDRLHNNPNENTDMIRVL